MSATNLTDIAARLDDTDCAWAVIVASVMLAQQRQWLASATALAALGMTTGEYQRWKGDLCRLGREVARRLEEAE